MYKNKDEENAWINCDPNDLWIFDKLILAKRLGYTCGPKGVAVPSPGNYIVRPCVNVMGMGRGAHIRHIEGVTDHTLPDGTFWCEVFTGRHLSVDYHHGVQVLCVEGFRHSTDIDKWERWEKVEDYIEYPTILKNLSGNYEWVNVEMIGGRIIEIHLRRNPDFMYHNENYVIPAYDRKEMKGHIFIDFPDHNRLGFFIPCQDFSIK